MKNIGFAKVGKSIKFRPNYYSPIGGDNEASCVLRALANHNPDKTFYVVGKSDFSQLSDHERLDLFPYDNVVDIWKGIKTTHDDTYYRHIITYFEKRGIVLDYTVMLVGQVGTVTIPGKIEQVKNRHLIASVIDMTKGYTTPISTWLNEVKPPYIEIINDPRYKFDQARDMFHMPTKSIGQYDFTYEHEVIQSYENQDKIVVHTPSTYAGVETAFCMDYTYSTEINTDRGTNFMIVLNEGNPSRYNLLNEWVLRKFDDVEVYGKWDDERTVTDKRFRGSLHITEIQKKLKDVKFTFIIPIAPGWVTAKYIEMIHAGVIPFLHPTYDEQKHLPIPDFFRPKNPEQFYKRMNMLIEDPEKYELALAELRKLVLKPEYYNGDFLNETIMKSIDEGYVAPDVSKFQVTKAASLEDFFS